MANSDAAFGLKPVRYRDGTPYSGACHLYYVPASDGTAIYIGDPVIKTGDANTTEVLGHPPGTLSQAIRATNGNTNPITGVVVGVMPVTNDSTTYRAASTERVLMVCDDPRVVYHIQDDGGGSLGAATVGLNADLISTGGSTATGISSVELDGGTTTAPAADATYQLTILRLAPITGNELADYAVWEVAINDHTERTGEVGFA